jgi:hypothetical protein
VTAWRAKTPAELRDECASIAFAWAEERRADGDPEGADIITDLARTIRRTRLTVTANARRERRIAEAAALARANP